MNIKELMEITKERQRHIQFITVLYTILGVAVCGFLLWWAIDMFHFVLNYDETGIPVHAYSIEVNVPEIQKPEMIDQNKLAIMHYISTKPSNSDDLEIWFVQLCIMYNVYDDDAPERTEDHFTKEEINLICRVVETETYGADFLSKTHVASVIFNRMNSDKFPDDVTEIITAENQFCYDRTNISLSTYYAVQYAYMIEDTAGGALFFNKSNCKSWASSHRQYLFTDNVGHSFYR